MAVTNCDSIVQPQVYMDTHLKHNILHVHVHVYYLLSNFLNSTDGCAIQIVLVAASLNEKMGLYILLHLLHTGHKVVVSSIDLSITWLTCCVWTERGRDKE